MTPPSDFIPGRRFRIGAEARRLAYLLEAAGLELGALPADSLEAEAPADLYFLAVELTSQAEAEELVHAVALEVAPKLTALERAACDVAGVTLFRHPYGGAPRAFVHWPRIRARPL